MLHLPQESSRIMFKSMSRLRTGLTEIGKADPT